MPPTKFSELQDVLTDSTNSALKTSNPNIPIKWNQNDRQVNIEIGIVLDSYFPQNVLPLVLTTSCDEKTVKVDISNKGKYTPYKNYSLQIELANPIRNGFCVFRVFPTTIEVKVEKDKE